MIRFIDVFKYYEDTPALQGLSFHIFAGEIFGLLGPNGAGKTTTVHILAGILPFDRGEVLIKGEKIGQRNTIFKSIGIAPQMFSLYENLTAYENLAFFGRLYGLKGQALKQRIKEALQFVRLLPKASKSVKSFSGGMKRRLNLAAALIHKPQILILDEPTVGVDPQSRNAIFENIRQLKAQGHTLIYTTHYMEEAEQLCDRVAIIDHGRLLACDTVLNLLNRYGNERILTVETTTGKKSFVNHSPAEALERLKKEKHILSFRMERATLEHVFLKLTGHSLRDN